MVIILFDIDQTLLTTGGAGKQSLLRSLEVACGPIQLPPGYSLAGKTDPNVLSEILTATGWAKESIPEKVAQALRVYPVILEEELARANTRPCPGVPELLLALSVLDHVQLGLYTGNIRAGTQAKLRAAGLDGFPWRWFACGDGLTDKGQVLGRWLEEMRAFHPDLRAGQVLVVGDAEWDVRGGKLHGARTLGVGTGPLSTAQLLALGADSAVPDLSDTQAVVNWILS
jgi:phosphoglycolate phosphatase